MGSRCNLDIKSAAAANGIYLYEIAEALGIADGSFSRKLRRELPDDVKEQIFGIIDDLSSRGKKNVGKQ